MAKITYKQHPDVTYEQELELLANIYRQALESYREKKGTRPGAPDDAMKGSKHDRATDKYTKSP
jgi:hypothetical protein